ncbi:MAG: lipoate--protein ligase family protein [Clostridia bacterium]|nr:lipoate--protein ligase family protein [Clostridia bacterium]
MIFVENPSFDPPFNQAFEEYVFERAAPGEDALILWRNDPAVVVGCYQNVYAEVNIARAAELNVAVVRRESGGGAVYHDRGNVNYTFITGARAGGDYAALIAPVARALNDMGVPAAMNRTSDIAVNGLKVSGSAQKVKKDRVLHHGTLLYDADLSRLHELADGERGCFISKGVKSAPWPVANIRECLGRDAPSVEDFQEALRARLAPGAAVLRLTDAETASVRALADEKYRAWSWTCGRSPAFTREAEWLLGSLPVTLRYAARRGVIEEISFDPPLPALSEAARRLTGARLETGEARAQLAGLEGLDGLWRALF